MIFINWMSLRQIYFDLILVCGELRLREHPIISYFDGLKNNPITCLVK